MSETPSNVPVPIEAETTPIPPPAPAEDPFGCRPNETIQQMMARRDAALPNTMSFKELFTLLYEHHGRHHQTAVVVDAIADVMTSYGQGAALVRAVKKHEAEGLHPDFERSA